MSTLHFTKPELLWLLPITLLPFISHGIKRFDFPGLEDWPKDVASNFSKDFLLPNVVESFRNEKFDRNIMKEMGKIGLLGPTIKGYGCADVNYVSYGLIMREIERIDSGYRSCASVQSSLVMQSRPQSVMTLNMGDRHRS
jgi:alkylation response protein AidB-like acyl-CoA dehydrogenase